MKGKKNKRKIRIHKIIIGATFIYIGLIFWNQNTLMKRLESKKTQLNVEIAELEKEIKKIDKEIQSSGSLQFIEKIARDELGMVKPREIIYIDKNKKKNHFLNIMDN